ncbi:MAG: serine/threonine protein kinase [Chloroflexi bacterium]|nr:serine/threonine protein kinase [Chloroflexota bacterium]
MDDMIGRTLGPYQITQPLGRGGMATVYKAYQPALQRYVAIKILPANLAQDPQFSERFSREARAVARLDHPNILPVYDFGQSDGVTYIVMKYVDGGTLKDVLERGKMPFDQAATILEQVASALDYAHGQGIVHRDIKPANILLARPDWALLSDFGLAKVAEATVKLTGTGVGMGTPEYMAPEQAHGLETDARADIYSLGVTLYAMITGQVPYTGSTPIAIILKHVNDPLPSPRAVNPAIPLAAEAAILKAMAKRPEDRQQSASALSRAYSLAVGKGSPVEATRLEAPGAPITERRPTVGGTILEPQPPTGRPGATVLEPARYPSETQPPPAAWPPAPPPPAAKKGGTPWVWIAGAAVAFVCLALVAGAGILGMAAIGSSTSTPNPPTEAPATPVPPTSEASVEVVALPQGSSATYLYNVVQPPLSDMSGPTATTYKAVISSQDELDIGPTWCAKDAATLDDNWNKTSFIVELDGRTIDLSTVRLGDYSGETCRGYFALARGWTPGEHRLVVTRTFSDQVNDGWCAYGAGDYVEEVDITVLSPAAAAAATQQAPPPLGAGHRVVEDFGSDRGLYTYQGACQAEQHVTGGALHQSVSVTNYEIYAGLPGTYNDFELTVEATFDRVDGSPAKYGVQFRKRDRNNYYGFYVSDNQQFLFGKLVDDKWSDIIPWQSVKKACHGNTGQTDALGVVVVGSHFEFYCNGTSLGSADDSVFDGGAIALVSGTYDATHSEVTFDNVSITGR